ncbi:Agouti-related protein [Sciurus carolinensis]|uniref:Agouti-related protein n=1 Tax=Sciurus carolinensis TaxID=30640 RepID=A0AA41NIH8_SCICA|nr:Agouti-related protein [Sciurus carolinensis]
MLGGLLKALRSDSYVELSQYWDQHFRGLGLHAPLKRTTEEQAEEALLQKAEALAEMLDPQNRESRSPRRCVRLHESCLGQQVPCCDPCATCYCRFFNAFCYCRKLGTATNPCSRT